MGFSSHKYGITIANSKSIDWLKKIKEDSQNEQSKYITQKIKTK